MALTPGEREAWLASPAIDPPHGVTSNFEKPSSFRTESLGIITSLLIIVTIVFAVWLYTKAKVQRKLQPEDYVIMLAYVSTSRLYYSSTSNVSI
jgi:hypothetical protein